MKSILISIKPQWVEKILNGEKTVEIRKSIPKCELPCKVYIYCTKGKDLWMHNKETIILGDTNLTSYLLNGKVVAEFTLNKVDCLKSVHYKMYGTNYQYNEVSDEILTKSCLTQEQVLNYTNGNDLYAWLIDELKIYDDPKELSDFEKFGSYKNIKNCPKKLNGYCNKGYGIKGNYVGCEKARLKRPPQSWCYVEEIGE